MAQFVIGMPKTKERSSSIFEKNLIGAILLCTSDASDSGHYNALFTEGARETRGAKRHADGLLAGRLGGRAAAAKRCLLIFFRSAWFFFDASDCFLTRVSLFSAAQVRCSRAPWLRPSLSIPSRTRSRRLTA